MKLVQRIVIVWLILFCLFWIPKLCSAEDMFTESWQQEVAREVHEAYAKFENAIHDDPTDFGCQVAELDLQYRIELILYQHADSIRKEVDTDNDRKELDELIALDEKLNKQQKEVTK